jgi:uncharacterized protein YciW
MSGQRVIDLTGLKADPAIAKALSLRADIFELTSATEAAVLNPSDPGGLSHALRAALALRVARLNESHALAEVYQKALRGEHADAHMDAAADPAVAGGEDLRLRAILAFTDLVAVSPRDATAADIDRLRDAGIAEPDIVRLAQLNAFFAYKIRLVDGLKLMGESA